MGAGATVQQLEIELGTESGTLHNKVRDTAVVPYLYALGSYNITDELVAFVELEGTAVDDVDLFEGGAGPALPFQFAMGPRRLLSVCVP